MNNYSWNLGPDDDYIEHKATGSAHYSKNWNKAKQDAYNAWYYAQNRARILASRAKRRAGALGGMLKKGNLKGAANALKNDAKITGNELGQTANMLGRKVGQAGRSTRKAINESARDAYSDARIDAIGGLSKARRKAARVGTKSRIAAGRAKAYATDKKYRDRINKKVAKKARDAYSDARIDAIGGLSKARRKAARVGTKSRIAAGRAKAYATDKKYRDQVNSKARIDAISGLSKARRKAAGAGTKSRIKAGRAKQKIRDRF